MQLKLQLLQDRVCALAVQESFIHHQWFVDHHLRLVAQLAQELCDRYPQADRDVVTAMVWLHDLGKILTSKKLPRHQEDEIMFSEGRRLLEELEFETAFVEKIVTYLKIFEQSGQRDLAKECIEIQIVSTADGCSHFIGPFFALYWYENPEKSVQTLIAENEKKVMKDWQQKIVLPEAKEAFAARIEQALEGDTGKRRKFYFA